MGQVEPYSGRVRPGHPTWSHAAPPQRSATSVATPGGGPAEPGRVLRHFSVHCCYGTDGSRVPRGCRPMAQAEAEPIPPQPVHVTTVQAAPTWGRYALALGVLVVAYVASALLGLSIDAYGGFAALVWPPTGIALAALLLGGFRLWPGVFLGAGIANLLVGAPAHVALVLGVGNTLEAVVAAVLLTRVVCLQLDFHRIRDAF